MKSFLRAAAVAAPLTLALGAVAAPAQASPQAPATATEAPAPGVPTFDFAKDCPPLPAGIDPTLGLCMQMVVTGGSMKLGGLSQTITQPMRITVQSVQADSSSNSEFTSVTLTGKPMTVPGGVLGLLGLNVPGLDDLPFNKVQVQPKYTGGFSFNLPNAGLEMKIKIINDAVGKGCSIGSRKDPLKLNLGVDLGQISVVDEGDPADPFSHPPILHTPAADNTFAVPKTDGCGLFGPVIDWKAGLPSASGNNAASFDTYLALAPYAPWPTASVQRKAAQDPIQQLRNLHISG
ncbi:hypothetical protein GCM10009527_080850 [Actinomadura nitritigenes]|uniref:Secreted protein n=1 Tax=Actinomadura nitritigenes TaxID=134602 RepID=A0ABS3QWQ6_9ACTN|nr:hypothetical protein [Actinomadura nitritigenes]MBO2438417.1 hypothetical protein [Actinomadura nitritigenes]